MVVPWSRWWLVLAVAAVVPGIFVGASSESRPEEQEGPPSAAIAAVGARHDFPIMPFGDSITTCCHSCSVPAAILPPDAKAAHTEPIQPYQGYMRPLWHVLARFPASRRPLNFSYVGRSRDCLFPNVRNGTRARTDDWPVRFEAYYGYTAMRLVKEGLPVSAVAAAVKHQEGGAVPAFTLLHVGTNDLLAVRTRDRIGGAIEGIRHLVASLAFGIATSVLAPRDVTSASPPPPPPENARGGRSGLGISPSSPFCTLVAGRPQRRAIVLSLPIPVQFGLVGMGAAGKSYAARAKRWRRHAQLVAAIEELFFELTGVRASAASNSHAAPFVRAMAPLRVDTGRFQRAVSACSSGAAAAGEEAHRVGGGERSEGAAAVDAGVDLVLVDQAAGFRTDTDLHGDGVHPAGPGEGKIAARYAAGIQAALVAWGVMAKSRQVSDSALDSWAAEVIAATTGNAPRREGGMTLAALTESNVAGRGSATVPTEDDSVAPPLLLSAPFVLLLASAVAFACCLLRRRFFGRPSTV